MASRGRVETLLEDLVDEQDALDAVVSPLEPAQWGTPTPAEGWTVRDQISHLAYFDTVAALALVSPERFAEHSATVGAGGTGADVALARAADGEVLLRDWRASRRDLADAAGAADETAPVPWYGGARSLLTHLASRFVETWAHGQDVRDALALPPSASERLRHICHLALAMRTSAHRAQGQEDDGVPVRLEATAPSGATWVFGPALAEEVIRGSSLELALVFTRRRHLDDTDVRAEGKAAARWLSVAQAYDGPPGAGERSSP